MIARFIGWLQAALAYFAGKQAGEAAIRTQEIQQESQVAHAVLQAETDAPRDRAAVADQLRRGGF